MRFRTRLTAVAVTAVAAAACAVAPATGALATPTKAAAHSAIAVETTVFTASVKSSGKACWNNTDTGAWRCFSSFAGMKSAIARTGHPLFAAPRTKGRLPASVIRPLNSSYLLNTDYADSNYQGTSYSFTTSEPSMCAGNVFTHTSLPPGWNDRISSFNPYGNCSEKLWENTGPSGDTFGYTTGSATLGSFNDKASAERVQ